MTIIVFDEQRNPSIKITAVARKGIAWWQLTNGEFGFDPVSRTSSKVTCVQLTRLIQAGSHR
jgi:hypothetical protein